MGDAKAKALAYILCLYTRNFAFPSEFIGVHRWPICRFLSLAVAGKMTPMSLRAFSIFALVACLSLARPAAAEEAPQKEGFAKPYAYERQALGYDPEGVEYRQNQAEDFQVVFITSLPFTALASYGLTGLASLAFRNSFEVNGDYFIPFVAGALAGSTAVACVSVLTNKYPPPSASLPASPAGTLVFSAPLVEARF